MVHGLALPALGICYWGRKWKGCEQEVENRKPHFSGDQWALNVLEMSMKVEACS